MRPSVRSVLSTITVVVLAMLATACSAPTTIDAAVPEATDTRQDQDRGVATDPLPAATPTVSFTDSAPIERDSLENSKLGNTEPADLDGDGRISEIEISISRGDYAAVQHRPAVFRNPDIAPVFVDQTPTIDVVKLGGPNASSLVRTTRMPIDADIVWIAAASDHAAPDCPDQPATQLAIVPLDASAAPQLTGTNELTTNITEVHYGPHGAMLLYSTCQGVTRPAAFATLSEDGLTDVRPVPAVFDATVAAYPPLWVWGTELPTDEYDDPGALLAVVPQQGIASDKVSTEAAANVYVDVATGDILDVWATPDVWHRFLPFGRIYSDGIDVRSELGNFDHIQGPLTAMAEQPWGITATQALAVGGVNGASILTLRWDGQRETVVTDRFVEDLAWSAVDGWLAYTGPDGTALFRDGTTIELSPEPGSALHFASSGKTLVVAGHDGYQTFEFPALNPLPPVTPGLTPFSELDSGGLGAIRVEMTVSDLREVYGPTVRMEALGRVEVGYCVWIDVPQVPGLSMLGEAISADDAVITSIVVRQGPWQTPSGVRLGSSHDEVFRLLDDQIDDQPHTYTAGNYLTFVPSDADDPYSIKFETNGHEVVAMHAGRRDWISYVEGCA